MNTSSGSQRTALSSCPSVGVETLRQPAYLNNGEETDQHESKRTGKETTLLLLQPVWVWTWMMDGQEMARLGQVLSVHLKYYGCNILTCKSMIQYGWLSFRVCFGFLASFLVLFHFSLSVSFPLLNQRSVSFPLLNLKPLKQRIQSFRARSRVSSVLSCNLSERGFPNSITYYIT